MAGAAPVSGVLGLLLVSSLLGVRGERPGPGLGAQPERRPQLGPGAAEARRRPPAQDQRERARAGILPLGALYTAAVVAFVLYKCLQGKDEAAVLQEEKSKKSLQSEQQLAQLTQQLARTEQHLNSLVMQLDPLFERVTTLVGAQRELLDTRLQTIHQLLQDYTPDKDVDVSDPEASLPFPEDLQKENKQETGDSQAWEDPIHWTPETRNPTPSWEGEWGLRRRCSRAVAQGPCSEGSVKQSLLWCWVRLGAASPPGWSNTPY